MGWGRQIIRKHQLVSYLLSGFQAVSVSLKLWASGFQHLQMSQLSNGKWLRKIKPFWYCIVTYKNNISLTAVKLFPIFPVCLKTIVMCPYDITVKQILSLLWSFLQFKRSTPHVFPTCGVDGDKIHNNNQRFPLWGTICPHTLSKETKTKD